MIEPAAPLPGGAPTRRAVLLWAGAGWAVQAAAAQTPPRLPAVVVWDFDNQTVAALSAVPRGQADWLQRTLSESLVSALLQTPGQTVVDRLRLQEVLAEQKLASGALADEATRLRLGRIAGAERMVFGGFFVVGDAVQVNVRVVDTASSRVLFSEEATAPLATVMQQQPQFAARVAQALGGRGTALADHPAEIWQAHDQALALADAGRLDEAVAALQQLLQRRPAFEPAERSLTGILQRMARR
jgi:TolB-like protein